VNQDHDAATARTAPALEPAVAVDPGGTVMRIPVVEGQAVNLGDLLVELDATELKATGRQADVAAQTLRQVQPTLDDARSARWC